MEPWQRLGRREGSSGYVQLVTDTYRLPDGRELDWDLITGPDTVAILPITTDGRIVLVRQYRPGPGRVLDELPGGGIEPGESPAAAAARELLEETGYAGTIEVIGSTWLAGNATRRRWAAVARDSVPVAEPTPDEGELVEPVLITVTDFRIQLRSGQLTDTDIGYLGLDHEGLLG